MLSSPLPGRDPDRRAARGVPGRFPDRIRSWHPEQQVRDLLVADEQVYEFAYPDWRVTLLDQAPLGVAGLVVAMVVAAVIGPGLALAVVLGSAAVVGWRALDAWHTRYVLTDFRVLRTSGVLDRNVEFIPWSKVTDVSLRRSLWQRAVGASTIRIESANEASQFRAMTDVRSPNRFFRKLQQVMAEYASRVEVEQLPVVEIPRHRRAVRRPR